MPVQTLLHGAFVLTMKTGDMRHRVQIQRPIETANGFGEMEQNWQTIATRWCAIEGLTAKDALNVRELFAGGQVQANIDHKVRMRYVPGLTPKMRLQQMPGGRVYHIVGRTNPGEQKAGTEMVVMVREEV